MTGFEFSTDSDKSFIPPITGLVLAGLAIGAAAIGPALFQPLSVLVAFLSARELARMLNEAKLDIPAIASAFGAALFPAAAAILGEGSAIIAAGIFIVLAGAYFVIRGVQSRVLASYAGTVFVSLYVGILSSYLVLIRRSDSGLELLIAFILMISGFRIGKWVVSRWFSNATWIFFGGSAGAVVAGLAALLFLPEVLGPAAVIALALIVAVAGFVGDLVASMIRSQTGVSFRPSSVPGQGGIIMSLHSLLVAAPAFFFGVKLYLL